MSGAGGSAARRRRGPSPAQAGANLLIHDLKNLAGRLSLLYQNLQQRYDDPLFKRTALDLLDDSVGHLRRLAGELRDHEERLVVKFRVNLNEILEEALRQTHANASGGVRVSERYGNVRAVWGDKLLLRQAFACAVQNALEAMDGRGTLSIRTAGWSRGGRPRVLVEIADDGPGMDEEFMRSKLLRPFSSTKSDGLGLGVYTMAQVAALHGGTLRILSGRGAGTRVRFHLPADAD